METGTVKWFDSYKGFGFIAQDNGEKDIFAHFSNIIDDESDRKSLNDDEKVEYTVEDSDKGLVAKNIKRIS